MAAQDIDHFFQAYTPAQQRKIAAEYVAGESSYTLAARYQIAVHTVLNYVRKSGGAVRPAHGPRIYRHNPRAFNSLTPEAAYWIGFLMADGWISQRQYENRVSVSLLMKDRAHLEKLRSFLQSNHRIYSIQNGKLALYCLNSDTVVADLIRYGVTPRKSHTAKAVPVLASNRDFWRGVIDGDGWVGFGSQKPVPFPAVDLVGSRDLVMQFAAFAKQFCPESKAIARLHKKRTFGFRVSGKFAQAMAEILYQDAIISLDRKSIDAQRIIEWKRLSGYSTL